jgi:hypothetical protein
VPTTLWTIDIRSSEPCSARLKVMAMMIQPMVSSMMAEATMTWPRLRRMKFISRTTMATILTEEIDSAVPMNSEVMRRSSGRGSIPSGRNSPSVKPQTKGTAMPATETLKAARRTFFTSPRSVSMPVRSSSIRMPSCETASIIAFCSRAGGNTACCASGQSAPKTEGPSRMPAISWPMTAGWPMRCMASPRSRPTRSSTTIWTRNTTSEGPDLPASAASTLDGATTANAGSAQRPRASAQRPGLSRLEPEPAIERRAASDQTGT